MALCSTSPYIAGSPWPGNIGNPMRMDNNNDDSFYMQSIKPSFRPFLCPCHRRPAPSCGLAQGFGFPTHFEKLRSALAAPGGPHVLFTRLW